MNAQHYQLLLRSFDAELSTAEQTQLQTALEQDAQLRAEQQYLQQLRQQLGRQQFQFGADFADQVLQKIANTTRAYQTTDYMAQLFPPIAISTAAAILLLVGFAYYQEGNISLNTLAGIILDDETILMYYGS